MLRRDKKLQCSAVFVVIVVDARLGEEKLPAKNPSQSVSQMRRIVRIALPSFPHGPS
jgi:hypothetical protein